MTAWMRFAKIVNLSEEDKTNALWLNLVGQTVMFLRYYETIRMYEPRMRLGDVNAASGFSVCQWYNADRIRAVCEDDGIILDGEPRQLRELTANELLEITSGSEEFLQRFRDALAGKNPMSLHL